MLIFKVFFLEAENWLIYITPQQLRESHILMEGWQLYKLQELIYIIQNFINSI